jgi:phage terminase large subunit
MTKQIKINFPSWAKPLFKPCRYKVLYGGRGSGKSYAVADALLIQGYANKIKVLCGREFQNSMAESVHSLLKGRIEQLGLAGFYIVQRDSITGANGTEFIFKGVRHNVESIKSIFGITHLWLEEASTISDQSWQVLKPTIREPGSEIWITLNPAYKSDAVYRELIDQEAPEGSYVKRVNWDMNKHFPKELDDERKRMQRNDPALYAHIWEGECIEHTDAQVFNGKWRIDEFDHTAEAPYYGLDFGFSQDDTAAVRCFIRQNTLYVSHEAFKIGLDIDITGEFIERHIPDIRKHIIRADSARPETISFMQRQGYQVQAVKKGKGSVDDGIAFIRSFDEVVIHPRCKRLIEEFRLYSYKVDQRSGDILPIIVDKYNHGIDALRYALEPLMRNRGLVFA